MPRARSRRSRARRSRRPRAARASDRPPRGPSTRSSERASAGPPGRRAAAARRRAGCAPGVVAPRPEPRPAADGTRGDPRSAWSSRARARLAPARSATSFSSTGDSGSLGGFVTVSRPRSSPWCRTGTDAVAPSTSGGSSAARGIAAAVAPFVGHVAAGRISSPTLSQTTADVAPVPSASSRAIRTRMSSPE